MATVIWDGIGDWVADAAANWDSGAPPQAGDLWRINTGTCTLSTDVSAAILGAGVVLENATFIVDGTSGPCVLDMSNTGGISVRGAMDFQCDPDVAARPHVLSQGILTHLVDGAEVTTSIPGQGKFTNTSAFVGIQNGTVGNNTMELVGTSAGFFVIDLAGVSIVNLQSGDLRNFLTLQFCDIQNGGSYAIELQECSALIENCTIAGVRGIFATLCQRGNIQIRCCDINADTGAAVLVQDSSLDLLDCYIYGSATVTLTAISSQINMIGGALGRTRAGVLDRGLLGARGQNGGMIHLTMVNVEGSSAQFGNLTSGISIEAQPVTYAGGRVPAYGDFNVHTEWDQNASPLISSAGGEHEIHSPDGVASNAGGNFPSWDYRLTCKTGDTITMTVQAKTNDVPNLGAVGFLEIDPSGAWGTPGISSDAITGTYATVTATYTATSTGGAEQDISILARFFVAGAGDGAADSITIKDVELTGSSVDGGDDLSDIVPVVSRRFFVLQEATGGGGTRVLAPKSLLRT